MQVAANARGNKAGCLSMRKLFMYGIISLSLVLGMRGVVAECLAGETSTSQGAALSALQFAAPESAQARRYLGVSGSGKFSLSQVPGDILILEMFSVYCPYCQEEAPRVNTLYRAILKRSGLKDKIELVGIGVGNTRQEVHLFKIRYKIPFALLADPQFSVDKILQGLMTPYFIVLKRNNNGSPTVIYSKAGGFGDPDRFLDSLVRKAGLKG